MPANTPDDSPNSIFQQALALQATGQWSKAAALLQQLLSQYPREPLLLSQLGTVALQMGQAQASLGYFEQSLALQPQQPEVLCNLSIALGMLGYLPQALERVEQAVSLAPGFAEARGNQARILMELGRFEDALVALDQALSLRPDYAEAHNNRGHLLSRLGRLPEALLSFEKACAVQPGYAEALANQADVLNQLKRHQEARHCCEKALQLNPSLPHALLNLGNAWIGLGQPEQALGVFDTALKLRPVYPDALLNKGIALGELRRYPEALAHFDQALQMQPHAVLAYVNKGVVLISLKRYPDALLEFDRALSLDPACADALFGKAILLEAQRCFPQAIECLDKLLAINPNYPLAQGSRLHAQMKICDWRHHAEHLAACLSPGPEDLPRAVPFAILALSDDPAQQQQSAALYARKYRRTPSRPAILAPSVSPTRRIRIGYFSADFYGHVTTQLIGGLFAHHDRDRFEVHGFSFGPLVHDDTWARLQQSFDRFHEVANQSDAEIAALSRALGIDIAVDLKGYTEDSRPGIFFERAAPLQVSYLGYPGTMGTEVMDYLVADKVLIPESLRGFYAEKIIYLPDSYQVNDDRRPIASTTISREDAGLPPQGFVFCCFNNNFKITPGTFDSWIRILQGVDGSVLWLYQAHPLASANLQNEAARRGIDPARLVFATNLPLAQHLARHRLADLFLDTLPYNAHTTTSDALWAGLPVLTCLGQGFAGRVAASILNATGLDELIASSRPEYEAMAIALARDPARLTALRARLESHRQKSTLFDVKRFARRLESAFEQIQARCAAGLKPDTIFVEDRIEL